MATASGAFDPRPWHVLNLTVNKTSNSTTTTFTWSATITTSGNPNVGPFGTGNFNMTTSPGGTTYVSGSSNNSINFSYDYRTTAARNRTITLTSSGVRTAPRNGQNYTWTLVANMGLAGTATASLDLAADSPPSTTYTVTYNGNGNTGGSTANTSYTDPPNTSGTIANNGFTRTGYYFTGWNTLANGTGTSYSQGGSFTSNLNLFAQWANNYYDISYSSNNGTVSGSGSTSSSTAYYSSTSLATRANGFTAPAGYSFGGWSTTQDNTADYQPGNGPTFNLDSNSYAVTYYAVWNALSYTLTYNANLGTVSPSSKTVSFGSTYGTLPAPPNVSRTGYSFNGWFTASSGGSQVSSTTVMGSADTTIYAQWTAATPVFSDQTITTTGVLNKNINTNLDYTVSAAPVTSFEIVYSGTGLDPSSWLTISKESGTNNGILAGKPTQIGTYTFIVRAKNSGSGDTDSSLITLLVSPAGKRFATSEAINLSVAKRFTGTEWVSLKVMRRFDGTVWQDIGNI